MTYVHGDWTYNKLYRYVLGVCLFYLMLKTRAQNVSKRVTLNNSILTYFTDYSDNCV